MRNIHLVSVTTFLAGVGLFAQTAIRPDPNGPSNIGRTQLTQSLDDIAANETTARRATIAAITTRTQAEARQRGVHQKILTLIGGLPEKTPLNAKSLGTTQADGFRIEKILFYSQPNFPVTALLYLPEKLPKKPPAANPAATPGANPNPQQKL